uniref:ATP synthase F0 subunit 8 n=1 Tax=Panagrolaimus sp. JU765 TaxID=591449 RepID=A0AC34QG16_9BILA
MNFHQNWSLSTFWRYSIYNFLLYLVSCGFFVYSLIDHYWRIAKTDDTKVSFGLFRYCKTVQQAGGQTSSTQCKEFLHVSL